MAMTRQRFSELSQQSKEASNSEEKLKRKHQDDALDEALKESFPASDPIAVEISQVVTEEKHNV